MREPQLHRGAPFWAELLQHDPEPGDPLARIEVPVELWQGFELLMRGSLVDVDAVRLPTVACRMLFHEIVGHRVEVVDGIADRQMVSAQPHKSPPGPKWQPQFAPHPSPRVLRLSRRAASRFRGVQIAPRGLVLNGSNVSTWIQ
jgi:hypothetical protein